MYFTANDGEYKYRLDIYGNGRMVFRCDALPDGKREYATWAALDRAVKAYDLSLRKNFTNTSACVLKWGAGVVPVEVTSLDGDKYAWIKYEDGKREKIRRDGLYAQLDQAMLAQQTANEYRDLIDHAWDGVKRWEPEGVVLG